MTTATADPPIVATPLPAETTVQYAPLDALTPSPLNPRKAFGSLDELAANISARGVLVPFIVRQHATTAGEWLEIVDGERRYRAAKQAGIQFVPVIRRDDLTDAEVIEIQLISAIQRQDLTPLEEARGYRSLLDSSSAKYSAAYIADRISRSEKYVVDRMRLLQLIAPLQELLAQERIGVGHAELLAKLKPEDQARAAGIDPDGDDLDGAERGGLWDRVGRTLALDLDDEDDEGDAPLDPFHDLKPVTVKELEAWIARHVRFDVAHFATTAPLEFGETAIRVEAATAQPGRGKKVIAITADYRVEDDARADERVYGSQSWKRADGTTGTTKGGAYGATMVDSPTCEHSVLGVFAVGPGYGTTLQVCIARDRCKTHWAKEIKEREKNAKLRASGQGAKVEAKEKAAAETWQERQKREDEARKKAQARYAKVRPLVAAAITAALPQQFDRNVFEFFWHFGLTSQYGQRKTAAPACKAPEFVARLVLRQVDECQQSWQREELFAIAKHWGVDAVAMEKTVIKAEAADAKAATKATTKAAPEKTALGGQKGDPVVQRRMKAAAKGKAAKKR